MCSQDVRDDYGSSLPVMLYALRPQVPLYAQPPAAAAADSAPAEARRQRLNEGLSLSLLSQQCTTYTVVAPPAAPSALPALRWQPGNAYHASGLCAAALDTATLPYRLAARDGPAGAIGAVLWVETTVFWLIGVASLSRHNRECRLWDCPFCHTPIVPLL